MASASGSPSLKADSMELDPEEFRQVLNQIWTELYEEATTAPLPIGFPPEVFTKLEKSFGIYASWDLIDAASERIRSDKQLEKTFLADLQHLCDDADTFQWPLDDPHYCLLLGLLKRYYDRLIAKLSENADQDQDDDEAEEDEA